MDITTMNEKKCHKLEREHRGVHASVYRMKKKK